MVYNFVSSLFPGSKCNSQEFENAKNLVQIHNLIEEVAYTAFAESVFNLNITEDEITEVQSGMILAQVKRKAHIEMYKKDGYIASRMNYLNQSQIEELLRHIGLIVHDRDTKLTDATYHSLTDLLMGLDDHNSMVKEILYRSWFKNLSFEDPCHQHLDGIKNKVGFYEKVNQKLSFDLEKSLKDRKIFWVRFFPGARGGDNSAQFINILKVRHFFSTKLESLQGMNHRKLSNVLTEEDLVSVFTAQCSENLVRNRSQSKAPLISDQDMTVQQLFDTYFPDLISVGPIKRDQGSNENGIKKV